MRRLGHLVVDRIVDHLEGLPDKPVTRMLGRESLEALLRQPLPRNGEDFQAILTTLERDVFGNMMHLDSPRFFAYVPGPGNYIGALAGFLAAGYNAFAGTWLEASGPAEVELVTIDWLRRLFGLPEGSGGLFVPGGSIANLTALVAARDERVREQRSRGVIYCSDQTHSSVDRAVRVMGLEPCQLRKIPVSAAFEIRTDVLARYIDEDRGRGLLPFCIVANAGTTNTGAVDDLETLARIAGANGLWLHVDAAYGGAAVFCNRGRELLRGIGLADSVTFDPHKWLFQPYESSVLLVKDPDALKRVFHILPEYLAGTARADEEINFCDYGVQLTRDFKALKLWLTLKYWGAEAIGAAVHSGFALAEHAQRLIEASPLLEVASPARMGILCFTVKRDSAERVANSVLQEGFGMLSTTVLAGETVLRLCTINPRTSREDLAQFIEKVEAHAMRTP